MNGPSLAGLGRCSGLRGTSGAHLPCWTILSWHPMGQGSRKSAQKSSFKRLSILLHKTLDKLLEKLDVAVFLLWVSVAFDRLLYLLVREQHFCRCFAAFLLVPFLARFSCYYRCFVYLIPKITCGYSPSLFFYCFKKFRNDASNALYFYVMVSFSSCHLTSTVWLVAPMLGYSFLSLFLRLLFIILVC